MRTNINTYITNKLHKVLLTIIIISQLILTNFITALANDQYDVLRNKYNSFITGGQTLDLNDTYISTKINSIKSYCDSASNIINANGSFSDISDYGTNVASLSLHFRRILLMTTAFAITETGVNYYNNSNLKTKIYNALIYGKQYYYSGISSYGNWWEWEVGIPLYLTDVLSLIYNNLQQDSNYTYLINDYISAIDYFTPNTTTSVVQGIEMEGCNKMWKCRVMIMSGIISKNSDKVTNGKNGMSPIFIPITTGVGSKEAGFYDDGSFIQHDRLPSTGGYGTSFIIDIANFLYLLEGTSFEVTDSNKQNLYNYIFSGYENQIYKGQIPNNVRGREISRNGVTDANSGHFIISAIAQLSRLNISEANDFKGIVKRCIIDDESNNSVAKYYYDTSLYYYLISKAIYNDSSITARSEINVNKVYNNMDRVIHKRAGSSGYSFGVSMSSDRIYNYESLNNENLKGWYTGDGMTSLYLGEFNEFDDDYWPTVDSYRLPGITVDSSLSRSNASGSSYLGSKNWVGGASVRGEFGVAGMELDSYNSALTARKSWFMFDDEIVCLGSGITDTTDNRTIETIVENKKLNSSGNNAFTVNGASKPTTIPWTESLTGVNWAHIVGNIQGADIGYYFPSPTNIVAKREARTGSWSNINASGTTTNVTKNYLSLLFNHGTSPSNASYQYVILPKKTAQQVQNYASAPQISVLRNDSSVSAVEETNLKLIAANFWTDSQQTAGIITCDKKASVIMKEDVTNGTLELGVSDPTHSNIGIINLEINKAATEVISKDGEVVVNQVKGSDNKIKLSIFPKGTEGKTIKVKFNLLTPSPADITSPSSISNLVFGSVAEDRVTLIWTASGDDLRIGNSFQYDLRYSTSPITESNFSVANKILLSAPKTTGAVEKINVNNLSDYTNYYFAIKASDEKTNWSGISNVVNGYTRPKDAPQIFVDIKDAYIRGGTYANSNYGNTTLSVRGSATNDYINKSLLSFDLTSINGVSDISSAKLKIYATNTNSADSIPINIYPLADANDGWVESSITWNNSPSPLTNIVGNYTVSGAMNSYNYYDVDVTQYVESELSANKIVGLYMQENGTKSKWVTIYSKENSTNKPQLTINYDNILQPTSDTYVRGGTYASANYGLINTMSVRGHSDASYTQNAYLKFDLSNISNSVIPVSARLRVYGSNLNSDTAIPLNLYTISNNSDNWDEQSINWNTAPLLNGSSIGSFTINGVQNEYKWYEIDVTSYIQAEMSNNKIATFIIKDAGNLGKWISFNSCESATYKPELVLSY